MREIKFRAWDKKRKEIVYLDFLNLSKAQFCGSWVVAPPDNLFDVATTKGNLLNFKDVELMQYTGLKDKNSVEIYEGDIVLVNETRTYVLEKPQEVFFADGGFYVGHKGAYECKLYFETCNKTYRKKTFNGIEIIGNIYENPELLGERK